MKSTGKDRSKARSNLRPQSNLSPNPWLVGEHVLDETPRFIDTFTGASQMKLLAKIRSCRLVNVFLGLTAFSFQNHLRTSVTGIGQIEIDELYVGVDRHGCQYVIPVQAKGGSDQLAPVQTKQDIACCRERFPQLECRAVAAQFMDDDLIALFELRLEDEQVKVVDEKHYRLVPSDAISPDDLRAYARSRAT